MGYDQRRTEEGRLVSPAPLAAHAPALSLPPCHALPSFLYTPDPTNPARPLQRALYPRSPLNIMQSQGPLAARSSQAGQTLEQLSACRRELQLRKTCHQLHNPQMYVSVRSPVIPSNGGLLASECACPSNGEEPAPVAEVVSSTVGPLPGPSNRVQKTKRKSVISGRNPATLEKALKTAEDTEQKAKAEVPKSCCSQKQPPTTSGSSAASPAPTTESSSSSSHEDGPASSESTAAASKPTPEVGTRPLNIQLETRKQNTGYSSAQVQGWKHMTIDATSEPKTILEEPSNIKSSCCGGGKAEKKEAPNGQLNHDLNLATPEAIHQQSQSQVPNGTQARIQPAQQTFGQSQPFLFYGGQHHFGNPMQDHSFPNPPTNGINYTNGVPSGQYPSFHQFGLGPQLSEGFENHLPDVMHNCTCGDACACLGCAVHPRNETTLRHLQEVTNFMIQDPFYANPSSPPYNDEHIQYQPAYPVPGSTTSAAERTWQVTKARQPYQQQSAFNHPRTTFPQEINGGSFWQPNNESSVGSVHATPTNELQHFGFQGPQNGRGAIQHNNQNLQAGQRPYQRSNTYHSTTIPAPQFATPEPASSTAAETPTLSPSSFWWQQAELPGCDDASGCRCGDGCQCVGCLTHGGHDGVPLPQADGDYHPSAGFSSPTEQRQMNSIDVTLETKPIG